VTEETDRIQAGQSSESLNRSRNAPVAFRVWQRYRYSYSAPVRDVHHSLMVIPPASHLDQFLLRHELDVQGPDGGVDIQWSTDQFGNQVCSVRVDRVAQSLDFIAQYEVARYPTDGAHGIPSTSPLSNRELYLEFTALTTPDDRMRDAAELIARQSNDERRRAELAFQWTAKALRFKSGVTTWSTPAANALQLGFGVCQDYTHLLLTVLRLLGIPAQYVSGHLVGEGAPHAWVQALFVDPSDPTISQIVGYDPTHLRTTGAKYITVALGRDFSDISPTSGSFRGRASGQLSYAKRAEILNKG